MQPLPPQLTEVPPPQTVAQAIGSLQRSSERMETVADKLLQLLELQDQNPEMHTVVINPGNNGVYETVDQSPWAAKSIAVLNPGGAPVFIGIGGVSARPASRAPVCPGASALVLPLEASDIAFGCDPAILLNETAVIWVFRYVTVQPLVLRQVP